MNHQTLERRELLAAEIISGPRLVSVAANTGSQFDLQGVTPLRESPTELTFRFDGQTSLDANTLSAIRIFGAGGDASFEEGNERHIVPGFLGFDGDDDGGRIVVARFAETVPDDRYQIQIAGYDDTNLDPLTGQPITALRDASGETFTLANADALDQPVVTVEFDVELGPRVVAVVPQPIAGVGDSRTPARNTIHVYFNSDPLSNPNAGQISTGAGLPVVDPAHYKLIFTSDTVENTDDAVFTPSNVMYDPVLNRASLTFASDLTELVGTDLNGNDSGPAAPGGNGSGTFRLRVGSGDPLPLPPVTRTATETPDTFGNAQDLATTFSGGTSSVVVDGGLIRSTEAVIPNWPGASDAAGLRDYRREAQLVGRIDSEVGINVYPYNFARLYGTDPFDNDLANAITPAQEQRVREVLDLYSERLGVQFVETEDAGLQIVTGDIRAITRNADTGAGEGTPFSQYRVNERDPSRGILVLDAGEPWYDGYGLSPDNRPSYFVETIRGIGNLLGIGNLFELPEGVGAGGSSPDEPNSETFSNDGNPSAPLNASPNVAGFPDLPIEPEFLSFSDVTLGQALHRPESNDVDFYEFDVAEEGTLTAETFAQRLDGSSLLDTLIRLYRVVPATASTPIRYELVASNDDFFSDDSFVSVDVTPEVDDSGQVTGAATYIVAVSSTGNDSYNGQVEGSALGGTTEGRYQLRLTFSGSQVSTITDTSGSRLDGDADGLEGGEFNFWFRVAREAPGTGEPRVWFVAKEGNADDGNTGELGQPLRTIARAFELAQPGDIVRLLPNAGNDGLITDIGDNPAYEIGRGGTGDQTLNDGDVFEVPREVTVMIDAGAILKLRSAKVSVGSESVDEDRSLAALQVLGTPVIQEAGGSVVGSGEVYFTSFDDPNTGIQGNPLTDSGQIGHWAGIEFRNDVDYNEGRPVWETEGIFLDYVSHANLQFGGGSIDTNEPTVAPLQTSESRPTLIYNTITNNAGAAISADPDSFRETNFHSPRFQTVDVFTSDYDRVGPEIAGNEIFGNTTNALFVRVDTPAADQLQPLTVSGRFDDHDIVHAISEVLTVEGNPGGPTLFENRPASANVTLTAMAGTGLAAGLYNYKITFVTTEGVESLSSLATRDLTTLSEGTITLDNLPSAPTGFAGRNLYRRTVLAGGALGYELVASLDRTTDLFVDDGATRGGLLADDVRPDLSGVGVVAAGAPSSATGQLLENQAYDYRLTFVDDFGGESGASDPSNTAITPINGFITLTNLPTTPDGFVGRNLYRRLPDGSDYELIAQLRLGETTYVDQGFSNEANLQLLGRRLGRYADGGSKLAPRYDARLSIDPGIIVKLDEARIEVNFGADFYAEGSDGQSVVFTSRADDRYGAGSEFDTNGDGAASTAQPGDWGGLVFRQDATASLDFTEVRFAGGGDVRVEGSLASFNAIEILQANARITNSTLTDNADGFEGNSTREGRGFNDESVIFVRGSQPVILNNVIARNEGAAISINPDSLSSDKVLDWGRSTGVVDIIPTDLDNQGPLVEGNLIDENTFNAMRVRSEIVTRDSIWDDTGIVHVVDGQVQSLTNHFEGAVRLKSDVGQSLVVKFDDSSTLVGGGRPLDIEDRIGGTLQVLGTPGNPVVLTSIHDCTVGAGFTPDGRPQQDTINSGLCVPIDTSTPDLAPFVDVIVLMDETFTMQDTQVFSGQLIEDLEAALTARGIGSDPLLGGNRYGAVGFSSTDDTTGRTLPVGPGGALFGTAAEYSALTNPNQFRSDGFAEPGYEAIEFALANYQTRPDAAKFIILASDEDRDILDPNLTLASTIASLQQNDFNFQAIVDIDIENSLGGTALAIDANNVYTFDGNNGFVAEPGGTITGGFFNTVQDYVSIVNATGGIAGDIDQIAFSPAVANAFSQALASSIVGQVSGVVEPADPGDWQGLQIQSYANDRNVAYILENERAIPSDINGNAVPDDAQVIGALASHEFAGDENERLGFNIQGTLATPDDQDVYRFTATGGTQVYIDIDQTSFGLDTVVELINVNEEIIASSDNSFEEATIPVQSTSPGAAGVYFNENVVNGVDAGDVRPLFRLGIGAVESPNAMDAGFRVVLPGDTQQDNTYYVRVRTANQLSQGQYQLALRLRETDEVAGSTVQLADIRYATTAIDVTGAPVHSPLVGDASERVDYIDPTPGDRHSGDETTRESENNLSSWTPGASQAIGNLSTSDRGSLVVSGEIGNVNSTDLDVRLADVDVYRVDVFAQQIEPDVFDSENRFVPVTFDVDYADGLGRVNSTISIFNAAGQLILHSRDSNVTDDQGRSLRGVDQENLDGGSAGKTDAYIGPVELPEGIYYVAVSSEAVVPSALDQFFDPDSSNPGVRLMPVNSVRRIADNSFDFTDLSTVIDPIPGNAGTSDLATYTAETPIITPFFDTESIVDYELDDLRLFVSYDGAITGNNNTILTSFNPFTGTMERLIGQSGQPTGDLAAREDGELYAFSLGPQTGPENNGNVGNFLNLSPVDGSATNDGDDGITFRRTNQGGNGTENDPNGQFDIQAIAFPLSQVTSPTSGINNNAINQNDRGFVIGRRDTTGRFFGDVPLELTRNILFDIQANNGTILSRGTANTNAHREFQGQVPYIAPFGAGTVDFEYGIVDTGAIYGVGDGGDITGMALVDGFEHLVVTDAGGIHRFNRFNNIPAPIDNPELAGYDLVIPTTFLGVVPVDEFHALENPFITAPAFSGMVLGPESIEAGRYQNTMFAVTEDAWLYAIDVTDDGFEPANIFYNGRSAVPLTYLNGLRANEDDPVGIAFSNTEVNPWHLTDDRRNDEGHGNETPYDQSRDGGLNIGNGSLYFGYEIDANTNQIGRADDDANGELAPGGSHGSVVSTPFDLSQYASADKPTLYFSYFLDVEGDDDYTLSRQQNDSFRVFGAGDDGEWLLLATNNDFRELPNFDEFDSFNTTGIVVQELFDDDDNWRQARVDISP
ncbi:MAG: hypothetical protein AAGC97_00535, partial [Planctomycetota bacterium]